MEIDQQLEQQINIKFLVKLGKSGPEICQMLQQAYGENALKKSTVFKWVQRYREGRKIPCTTKGQGALPLGAAMKTSIECILSCSVTAG
jgi:transposase